VQISLRESLYKAFNVEGVVHVRTLPKQSVPHVEFLTVVVKNQFVSRCDMWQLKEHLLGYHLYSSQQLSFRGLFFKVKVCPIDF
jgi:hypothetical protein